MASANIQIIKRPAHVAGPVRLGCVNGREGRVAKAIFTAISNSRRGSSDAREDEATAIQWTLWGKRAENAAEYLGKGSHVNIVGPGGGGRINNYEKDGATVSAMDFIAEEVDYLESRAESQARRARNDGDDGGGAGGGSDCGDPDAGGGHDDAAPAKPGKAGASQLPAPCRPEPQPRRGLRHHQAAAAQVQRAKPGRPTGAHPNFGGLTMYATPRRATACAKRRAPHER